MEGSHHSDAANDSRNRRNGKSVEEKSADYKSSVASNKDIRSLAHEIKQLEQRMFELARNLEFEEAALLRDQVTALKIDLINLG
jgi:excinuclease ABC subunit B